MSDAERFVAAGPLVAVGGVGGSGTRVIAGCLRAVGVCIGHDLNEADDNHWFTLCFKRAEILAATDAEFDALVDIFARAMTGSGSLTSDQVALVGRLAAEDREQHGVEWLQRWAGSLLSARPPLPAGTRWGWKEPNSHVVLDRLRQRFRDMKYIHVVRHGLDMAHSGNHNQLRLWGPHFLGADCGVSPYHALRFWCAVHRRILGIGGTMPQDFLLLNYDDFCRAPRDGIGRLFDFLAVHPAPAVRRALEASVRVPESTGRYRQHGLAVFAPEDVAYVRELGFDVPAG